MDKENLQDAMKMAAEAAREGLEVVRGMLPGKKESPRLTSKQQLDYFFLMTGDDFSAIRQKVGDDEFNQYFQAMRRLAERE